MTGVVKSTIFIEWCLTHAWEEGGGGSEKTDRCVLSWKLSGEIDLHRAEQHNLHAQGTSPKHYKTHNYRKQQFRWQRKRKSSLSNGYVNTRSTLLLQWKELNMISSDYKYTQI